MSYRQDLRAAELAVIEAALPLAEAFRHSDGVHTFFPTFEQVEILEASLTRLSALRSQIDAPVTPSSDDDTSANAARAALPMVGGLRRRIVYEVSRRMRYPDGGATDDQLERLLNRKHASVSAARNFLVNAGWLRDSGQRRTTESGRPAVVWVLTDFGQTHVVNLASGFTIRRPE